MRRSQTNRQTPTIPTGDDEPVPKTGKGTLVPGWHLRHWDSDTLKPKSELLASERSKGASSWVHCAPTEASRKAGGLGTRYPEEC